MMYEDIEARLRALKQEEDTEVAAAISNDTKQATAADIAFFRSSLKGIEIESLGFQRDGDGFRYVPFSPARDVGQGEDTRRLAGKPLTRDVDGRFRPALDDARELASHLDAVLSLTEVKGLLENPARTPTMLFQMAMDDRLELEVDWESWARTTAALCTAATKLSKDWDGAVGGRPREVPLCVRNIATEMKKRGFERKQFLDLLREWRRQLRERHGLDKELGGAKSDHLGVPGMSQAWRDA